MNPMVKILLKVLEYLLSLIVGAAGGAAVTML